MSKLEAVENVLRSHPFLSDELQEVKATVASTLRMGNRNLDDVLRRFVDNPGKMLRPALVVLSGRMARYDAEKIRRLAAAVEILHIATLVHDDIIDESPVRRGVPTVHITDGIRRAVLVGDYLFTRCFGLIADLADSQTAGILASGVGRICESEMDKLTDGEVGLRRCLRKTAGKTAMLFVLSTSMGARECGGSEALVSHLRFVGYGIGMSFQITDDILDYVGNAASLGKPVGRDLQSDIVTLPLILARRDDPAAFKVLERKRRSRRNVSKLRKAVVRGNGIDHAGRWIDMYTNAALGRLQSLPESDARNAMWELASALRRRES